ncbi:MAG: tRNA (guanosine(46)-N7)-methyltransferase TrmB, partial [Gemmata sp.]
MRKPRRLSSEQLAPWVWEPPWAPARGAGTLPARPTPAHPTLTRIDWPALFGNANPVEIEVGTGKG